MADDAFDIDAALADVLAGIGQDRLSGSDLVHRRDPVVSSSLRQGLRCASAWSPGRWQWRPCGGTADVRTTTSRWAGVSAQSLRGVPDDPQAGPGAPSRRTVPTSSTMRGSGSVEHDLAYQSADCGADRAGVDQAAGGVAGKMLLRTGIVEALRRRAVDGGTCRVHVSLARVASWILSLGVFDLAEAGCRAGRRCRAVR